MGGGHFSSAAAHPLNSGDSLGTRGSFSFHVAKGDLQLLIVGHTIMSALVSVGVGLSECSKVETPIQQESHSKRRQMESPIYQSGRCGGGKAFN